MEKRFRLRNAPIYRLAILTQETSEFVGFLLDIHPGGMMLLSDHPQTNKEAIPLRLVLPAEILGRKEILFAAKCVWNKPAHESPYFRMGFRFTDISLLDRKIIELLIKNYCAVANKQTSEDLEPSLAWSNGSQ